MSIALHSPLSADSHEAGPRELVTGDLVISDLSLSARRGVRGSGAADYLQEQGFLVPDTPNRLCDSGSGHWVMALSQREFWLLCPRQSAQASFPGGAALAPNAWPLYCQHSHAWLVLSGQPMAKCMAKLCGVDLCPTTLPVGHVAQTQVARVGAIVAHHPWHSASALSLFVDQSYAAYLWEVLADAMEEYR